MQYKIGLKGNLSVMETENINGIKPYKGKTCFSDIEVPFISMYVTFKFPNK